MGDVIEFIPKRSGTTAGGVRNTVAPMRQPGLVGAGCPASHFERLGTVVARLVEGIERRVEENAITNS